MNSVGINEINTFVVDQPLKMGKKEALKYIKHVRDSNIWELSLEQIDKINEVFTCIHIIHLISSSRNFSLNPMTHSKIQRLSKAFDKVKEKLDMQKKLIEINIMDNNQADIFNFFIINPDILKDVTSKHDLIFSLGPKYFLIFFNSDENKFTTDYSEQSPSKQSLYVEVYEPDHLEENLKANLPIYVKVVEDIRILNRIPLSKKLQDHAEDSSDMAIRQINVLNDNQLKGRLSELLIGQNNFQNTKNAKKFS